MSSPSTAITRLDLSISYAQFALEANRLGYVGLQVMPPLGVQLEAADFAKLEVGELTSNVEDTARAPRSTYARDSFTWTKDSYAVQEHGVEDVVDDATIERYGDVLRAEVIHTQRAINRVLQRLEYDIATALFNATTFSNYTTAAATAWTTRSTAVPVEDIDDAIESVIGQCGMRPNALILSDYALTEMVRTAQIQDLLKYSGADDPKSLRVLSGLKELWDLEHVIVGKASYNSAIRGATPSFSRHWNATMAFVAHINYDGMAGDLEAPVPNLGRTIFSTSGNDSVPGVGDGEDSLIVEEYREESRRGGIIRARNKRHAKLIHLQAGHLITAVTA